MPQETLIAGDTYAPPIQYVNASDLTGCQAELVWLDPNTGLISAWWGTSEQTAPSSPVPPVVGSITNTAPLTAEMQVVDTVLALPVGLYQAQLHFWDAAGNRKSSPCWTVNLCPSLGT